MPGFDVATGASPENENPRTVARRARYGRILFVLYLLLYGGFVLLNAFGPTVMSTTPLAGINLAVLYGLALIAIAFVLAVFYDWLCRPRVENRSEREDGP